MKHLLATALLGLVAACGPVTADSNAATATDQPPRDQPPRDQPVRDDPPATNRSATTPPRPTTKSLAPP